MPVAFAAKRPGLNYARWNSAGAVEDLDLLGEPALHELERLEEVLEQYLAGMNGS